MPNLVGIGNSQVPTNAMLGGLAYQDPTHANLENVDIKDIASIKNRINTQGRSGNGIAGDTTVADIFVYDTRGDSDGGAWRKRTQHTSWYNESLNTEFRGGRREFPSIAVLVSHSGNGFYGFSIYDGDDPSLPLWMHFHIDGYNTSSDWGSGPPMIGRVSFVSFDAGPICAMNGQISLGNKNTGNGGWHPGWMVNMISEKCLDCINYGSGNQCYWMSSNIADRVNYEDFVVMEWTNKRGIGGTDDKQSHGKSGITGKPTTGEVRSIAMTVTPDAMIDNETGLPIPTQAWAGKNNVSVFKGSTSSWENNQYSNHTHERAEFNSQFDIVTISRNGGAPNAVVSPRLEWPSYNSYTTTKYYHANRSQQLGATMGTVFSGEEDLKFMKNPYGDIDDLALIPSSQVGLNLYLGDGSDGSTTNKTTICARITPDFNTGWMMGDCDMALMMDTSPTNITQAVHVDESFDSTGSWTFADGASISSSRINLPNQSSARATHNTFLQANTKYMCQYQVIDNVQNWQFDDDGSGAGQGSTTTYQDITHNAGGTFTFVFRTTGSTRLRIMRTQTGNGTTINIQYIRFYKIEQDVTGVLGCNNRQITNGVDFGCATMGTLVRNSVSTTSSSTAISGADAEISDVVAYSSWGSNNYLIRGHSSDFDIGTDSFVMMGWVFPSTGTTSSQTLCGVGDFDQNNGFIVQIYGGAAASGSYHTGNWRLDAGYLGTNNSFSSSNGGTAVIGAVTGNKWNMWAVYNKNNTFRMFINGQFAGSWGANSINWTTRWNAPHLLIGGRPGAVHTLQPCAPDTRQAMVRWGIAPTSWDDDKFRQIYEDEKQLFRPGAKAVLTGGRGSSWRVKDIDFDTRTDTLHVASAAGTSEFRRLVRINSTVGNTSLISAQGGMVVEAP